MARTSPDTTTAPHIATATEGRLSMTYEEWLAWDDGEGPLTEWVDGEVIVFMPPKTVHQALVVFLVRLLGDFVDLRQVGRLFVAAFEMRLAEQRSSREPDILVVLTEHLHRVTEDRLDGPADLVVEIVSDDSVTRDRVDKLAEYAAAGIPEYWVLDPRPRQQRAQFLRLGDDGRYREMPLDQQGRYHSAVLPGFWLDPAWLWQEPLPSPRELLERITTEP